MGNKDDNIHKSLAQKKQTDTHRLATLLIFKKNIIVLKSSKKGTAETQLFKIT